MDGFLGRLIDGLNAIPETALTGSESKTKKGEEVIGEITSVYIRRLFHFMNLFADDINKRVEDAKLMKEEMGNKHNVQTCPKCNAMLPIMNDSRFYDIVSNLYWAEVKNTLPIEQAKKTMDSDCGGIAIRDGWKIVTTPAQEEWVSRFGGIVILG